MKFNPRNVRLLPAFAAAAVFIAASTLTRIALALRPEVAALDAADLFRNGLLLDEEQVAPALRFSGARLRVRAD